MRKRLAAGSAAVFVASMLPVSAYALGAAQAVDRDFRYECDLGAGSGAVSVEVAVSGEFPAWVRPGRALQPSDMEVSVALPASVVDGLRSQGAASLSGSLDYAMGVDQGRQAEELALRDLPVPDTALPESGGVEVTAEAESPEVKTGSPGKVVFTAGELSVALDAMTADGAPVATAGVSGRCTPAGEQDLTIASVQVAEAERPPEEGGGAGAVPGDGAARGQGRDAQLKKCPPDPIVFPNAVPGDGYIAGFGNIKKLDQAMFIKDPGHLVLQLQTYLLNYGAPVVCPQPDGAQIAVGNEGTLDYAGGKPQFPPITATFLAFGFLPASATVEISLDRRLEVQSRSLPPYVEDGLRWTPQRTVSVSYLNIRMRDVKVNGTRLDVGQKCGTAEPLAITMVGLGRERQKGRETIAEGYTVRSGGVLEGAGWIPPFRGCKAAGDVLDGLFTAQVNGPGNYNKLTQAPLCIDTPGGSNQKYCPDPPRPDPEH